MRPLRNLAPNTKLRDNPDLIQTFLTATHVADWFVLEEFCKTYLPSSGRKLAEIKTYLTQSGKAMARTGLRMMPTFPSPPLKFRTAGFPRYGFKAGLSDEAFPMTSVCLRPSCSSAIIAIPCSVSGTMCLGAPPCKRSSALPQGPSLRSELCCLGPSSLNRPHPPHSWAHPDFAALRLIPDALAVRFRLGDP